MRFNDWFALLGFILISQLAGIIGSLFTVPAIPDWYSNLIKPVFIPPDWVFGFVWTILYFLMGVAAFIVYRKGLENLNVKRALYVFIFHLPFNSLWSILFFGLKNPGLALIEIFFLLAVIAATIFYFAKVSRLAAWLLAPYILWVSFAIYLNFSIWNLN